MTEGDPAWSAEAAELIAGRRAPGHLRRRRHPEGPGGRGAARAGRAHRHPRRHHPHGPRRLPRLPPAVPGHAGHARQLHRRHRHAAGRPADRPGHAASTTGSPARSAPSPPRPRSSTSTSTRPSWARSAGPTSAIAGDCRLVIEELLEALDGCLGAPHGDRRAGDAGGRPAGPRRRGGPSSARWQEEFPLHYDQQPRAAPLKPQCVVETLARRPPTTPSSPPASASTRCGPRSTGGSTTPTPGSTPAGAGTMGFAVPAAIGAKVGRPDQHGVGRRRRRLLPDDRPGAGHRHRPSGSRSRSPS